MAGALDEMFRGLRREERLFGRIDDPADFHDPVLRQVDDVVAPEERPIGYTAYHREPGGPGQGEASRKTTD